MALYLGDYRANESAQVRGSAKESFVQMVAHFSEGEQRTHVVPIISKMAKINSEEDHRIEAAEVRTRDPQCVADCEV